MKKLFAMFLALTMTFQLITPAWADAAEAPEEITEASEVVEEEEEEIPETTEEETTEATEETLPEETTEATEEETEVTEPATEELPEEKELTMEEVPEEEAALQSGEDVLASGTCGENLTWVVYEDGKLVISGHGEMDDYGEYSGSGGYSQTKQPWKDYDITSLDLSDGITKIGAFAFCELKKLSGNLKIPDTVTSIGAGAFKGTSFQGELKLPDGLTEIAAMTFENCDGFIGTLKIPEGTASIGDEAFYRCRNLIGELAFPEGLTSIGSRAFSGCIGFNGQLNFPSSLAEIGDSAFSDCSGFRGELVIPETLTSIGSSAFSGCSGFSGFSLPENMTVIPDGMFSGWKGLTGVLTIPEYITGIGNSAFSGCSGLTGVHFSANLESIGDAAFSYCTGLKEELSFPYGLKTIGNSAFGECISLTGSVIIPDSVTSIGANAFSTYGRYSLSGKLVLPKGIHFVDSNAFNGCYGLKTLYIPAEVIQIRADAFEKCNFTDIYYAGTSTQWQNVDIRSGNDILSTATLHFVESSGTTEDGIAWQYGSDGILTITGTGAIPDYTQESPAPWQGTQPVSLVIGDGITGIGTNAFADCETLCYVYFGGTKEVWSALPVGEGNDALSFAAVHCGPELRCVPTLVEEKQSTCAEQGNNAYYLCPDCGRAYKDAFCIQETSAEQETRALLPHNTEVVWAVQPSHSAPGNNKYFVCKNCGNAFKDQEGKIPTTVEAETLPQLPGIASGNCGDKGDNVAWVLYEDGLLEISGTGDMKNYNNSADWYDYRDQIKTVNIQDGVTSVGDWAFSGYNKYTKLENIYFPDSIQRIGKYAFYGCTSLKGELVLPANLKRIEDSAFSDCTGITGTLSLPQKLEYLSGFNGCTGISGALTIPESVTEIGNDAFLYCRGLTGVLQLPKGLTSIGNHAFGGTGFAGTLTFPESLRNIGDYAFNGCTGFTGALAFPEGLTGIGDYAFVGCTGFAGALTFSEGLTSIGAYAFQNMSGLWGTLVLPTTLESIGEYAFFGCNGFSGELKLQNSATKYGWQVFRGCTGITSVAFPEGMTKIPDGMFYECTGLQGTLVLPDTITEIESQAFYYCTNITGLQLPANLKKVEASAFDQCSIKGELILPDGLIEIGTEAFHCLDISGQLVIPDSVRTIGQGAFGNNDVETLILPNGIQIIDEGTFRYCYHLKEVYIPQSVIQIRQSAFSQANIANVYYAGTLEQWKNINIRTDNGNLSTATLHYIQSSGTCGDTLSWKIDSDNVLTVSGTGAMPDYTADSPAPWSDASFTGLVVEEGVTHIGAYAFYVHDTLAGTPSLPATLETVGESAFHGCAPDYFRYNGTPEAWAKVTIGEDNEALQTVHYLEHTLSLVEAVPATCTQAGNNAYYLCDICHQAFLDEQAKQPTTAEDQVLPALSHNTVHVDTKEATCTENGMEAHYTCENCGKLFRDYYAAQEVTAEDLTIPALGHTMQETQEKVATCTETGNNAYYTCITCGIVFQDDRGENQTTVEAETIPALGHTMVKTEAVAATCTESGTNAYYTCTTCGNSYKDAEGSQKTTTRAEFLPALGHTMKRIDTQAPTCTEDGNRAYYVCDTCHRAFKDASGFEATTAEAEVLPALGHRMTETQAKAATCTTSGNNTYFTCGTCHKVYKDADGQQETTKEAEILPALGHSMTETAAKEATCTASGNNAYFTCATCRLVFKDGEGKQKTTVAAETLKALGHKMTKTAAKAATCTEDGNNVYYTCATCHKVYKDQQGTQETTVQAETLKALGHSMTETPAKAATCTESGNNTYFTCGTCHKIYKDRLGTEETTVKEETLPALGHTMAKTEAKEPTCTASGNNAYYTCETCHQVFKDELGQRRTTVSAEKLSAFGHTMKKTPAKAATCTEPGNNTYYTCITCGVVFQDEKGEQQTTVDAETISALGHTMEETPAVAPTCTEGGSNAYFTCETCHKVFKDAEGKQGTTVKAETLAALGHHMILTVAVAPSCTESGNRAYYTCSTCQGVYKDWPGSEATTAEAEILPALGHRMTETPAKAATCTTSGNNAYFTCSTCHKVFKDADGQQETTKEAEILPALGHTMTETAAKEATCTASGNNAYFTCATCHQVFKDGEGKRKTTVAAETLKALGHKMTKTAAKAATCTEDGNNIYFTCSACHKVYKDQQGTQETTVQAETLKAFGHSMTETPAKAATCTESGNNTYFTCSTCHKVYKDRMGTEETTVKAETLPALGHTMVKTEAKEPTCTESGTNAYYTCSTCRLVFKDQLGQRQTTVNAEKLSAFGHTMKKTAPKEATCTEPGNNLYYTCITCGIVFQDEKGEQQTTVDAETISALGHTMEETPAVAPTCTEGGNNAYFTCETCHKVFKDAEGKQETTVKAETLAALGHAMVLTEAVAPTCTEPGTNAYYTCATCHKVYKDVDGKTETNVEAEILAPIGHKMEAVEAKDPTCTESGTHAYYLCANCGKAYLDEQGEKETSVNAETIPALGHTMKETSAVAPTCTEGGNNAYFTCATCHKVYKDAEGEQETSVEAEILAPLGHSMTETPAVEPTHTSGGNNAYYTCSVCHKVFQDVDGKTETTVEDEQLPRLPGLAHGTSGSLFWFLSEEEVLTVSGNGRMPDYSGNDLAPWYNFRGKIQKVVLEEGVQTVGSYAFFDCNMLTEVELPQSVTKLGKSCFDGCGQLKLLRLEKVPAELTQKVTDLNGLATLAEPIGSLVGNRAAYHWSLETVRGENHASDLAKLDGSKLEVIHSGKFYLVCEEDYTGLSAALEVGAKTSTEIRPDTEQLASGESLTLSAWAMPFDTRLSAKWTLDQESEAYASIASDGTLTAKAVTAPVQITVKAEPVNGEEAAEKALWILPKTTGLGILADGHLAGETLTVDLTETRELTLSAQIQPQGAGTKVAWTSSREDVAVIDETGKVLLLKPGKTLIRAETQDGSGIATELTLTVRYLDSAETLTLTAQIPETGLEPGMTAKLTLSGENAIDAQNVTFYIPENQAAVATIDETGTLTAGTTPGTVTVTAALKDDPLMRQAQLTVTVNPMLNHALRLESNIPEGLGYVDGSTFYGEIAGIAGQNRSFALKVQGQDYLGNWAEAKNVTYASSNSAIAAVDASGTVSLTAKEEGTCLITVRCTDALEAEAQLTIVLQNSAPRLGAATVTLNSNSTQGADVDLVASYGNTVDTVTVYDYNKSTKTYALSSMFTAEAEEGTLTLYSLGGQKNGTYPVKLEVACRTGVYTFTMNVKVANTLPKVTAKQTEKLNLFYKNSTAPLAVTATGQTITDVVLTDTDDFTLVPSDDGWEIVYTTENAKPDTKGTLNVYLEGYQEPVKVNLTVGTVTTAPAVKLSATSSTLNTALNSELTTRVTLLDKAGQPLELENPTVDCSSADVFVKGSLLTITLDEAKSTTVTLYLQDSTWAQSVKLTHKVTVSEKLPTLKPAGNLTLNSLFAKGTAETGFILSQSNLTLVNVEATPAAKEGTPALAESEKLRITYDPETGRMVAQIDDASIKAGTYSFNCTGTLEDGTPISGGTLKVTVSAAAPKVKLSAVSVKLNKFLAGQEQGSVTVTVSTGYQVADFTGKSEGMAFDEDTGILTAALEDASDDGGSYDLYPVVRDVETGEEVELPTKLSFKVQTYNSQKLSVSLSAKGKLDTQTDSEILYTVTKLTGCLGTVDNVILEGQDANLFRADMDVVNGKPTVHLTLKDGETYATNKAYKIQFRFTACGTEILSPVQTVKVTQTALKVAAPKNITYYQAQKSPLRVVLTTNVPLDRVVLNDKTAKEFQAAVGEVTLNGNRVEFEITNPAALTAGKSYSVVLDATPENNAENAKPVAVRLTVKVMK